MSSPESQSDATTGSGPALPAHCHEVALADAICRIEIVDAGGPEGLSSFAARLWRIGADGARHQLLFDDGRPLEIRGRSETLALSSAIAYLADRYGGLSEYAHACGDFTESPDAGSPILLPGSDVDRGR